MKGFGEVGEKFFKKIFRFFDFLSVSLLSSLRKGGSGVFYYGFKQKGGDPF
ncbi:MAG: hypothetical protein ACLRT5_12750 [Lachnospiraceae bacterium]